MSRGLRRCAIIVLLLYIVAVASFPRTTAEVESRTEIKSGDLLYNRDEVAIIILRALFHQETLANTGTETFAMSPLSAASNGLNLAQASADTIVASQTGLSATLRFSWVPYDIGTKIGDSPGWAADVKPISLAGIPRDSMMIFPSMTMIKRIPYGTGNTFNYIIDANASLPVYPGNMMLVKNVTDDQGRITTILERPPRDYWAPTTSAEEIADKTIIQRIWANSHIVYKMDEAYVGETSFPTLIWPVKGENTLIPMIPDQVAIEGAMNMTRSGMHMRKIFWPVA